MMSKNLRIVIIIMTVLLTSLISVKAQDALGNKSQKPELYVETLHTDKISTMTVSPDGKLLATVGWGDRTVKLWDIVTGRELKTLRDPSIRVSRLKFSPDGQVLAIGGDDAVKLLDLNKDTQQDIKTESRVNDLIFTPDGKSIITFVGLRIERGTKIWNVADGHEILLNNGSDILNTCNYQGTIIVTNDKNDNGLKLWDAVKRKELTQFRFLNNERFVRFSPDGKYFITQIANKITSIKIWDIQKGQVKFRKTFNFECSSIECETEFTPDGKYLFIFGFFFNSKRRELEPTLLNLSDGIETSLKQLLKVRANELKDEMNELKDEMYASFYEALSTSGEKFILWYLERMAEPSIEELRTAEKGFIKFEPLFAYEPSKKLMVVSCKSCRNIKIIDLTTRQTIGIKLSTSNPNTLGKIVKSINFIPGSDIFFVMDEVTDMIEKSRTFIWKIEKNKGTISAKTLNDDLFLTGFTSEIYSPAISPDNKYIACFTSEKIYVWDLESATNFKVLKGVKWLTLGPDPKLWFSPDSKILVVQAYSGILLLNLTDGSEIPLEDHDVRKSFSRIAFTANGRLLAGVQKPRTSIYDDVYPTISASDGRDEKRETIKVWDVSTGKKLESIETHASSVDSIAFSKDGIYLASMSDGYGTNLIELWNVESGAFIKSMPANGASTRQEITNLVPALYENKDGYDANSTSKTFTATRAENGKIKLINRATKDEVASLIKIFDDLGGGWVVFTPDGFFDTNYNLEFIDGIRWTIPNEPLKQYPLEIFMRDYYEPRLLPRVLRGDKLPELPSFAKLNRAQPKIEKITVAPQLGKSDLVDVTVEVSSTPGMCLKGDTYVSCESGVYDLRLYRDGQLVKQSPSKSSSPSTFTQSRQEQLQQWRTSSLVITRDGQPITTSTGKQAITFTGIRLPQRSGVSQVNFTAYAFNKDRVKSATSEAKVYPLKQPRPGVKRRAFVITIGIDATSNPRLRLGFAPTSARDIGDLLRKKLGSFYDEVVPVQLISEYKKGSSELQQDIATKDNIQTVLNLISTQGGTDAQRQAFPMLQTATPDDLVVLYIASHGYVDPNGKFYVVPSDIGKSAVVSEELLDRCLKNSEVSISCQAAQDFLHHTISSDELTQWIQSIDAGQMVLILDSCHSGAVSGPGFKPGPMGDSSFGQLSYDKGMLVLAATQAENVDWGTLELGNRSLLTYALTQQEVSSQLFDLKRWLSRAEEQVPQLYNRFIKSTEPSTSQNAPDQEPILFDFSEKGTTKSMNYQ